MSKGPWSVPAARQLLIARGVSGAGSMIQVTAAGWYVLQQTGSASAVGVLAALSFAPSVVGSPVGGWMADRYDIRRLAALLCVLQAISPFVIGLLIWDNAMPIPALFVLIFLGAIPGALAAPATGMLPPMSVPKEMKSAVIADAAVAYNLARVAGPLIGSALVALISMGGAFLVNGLSFLYIGFVIYRVKLVSERPQRQRAKSNPYIRDVRRGWGYAVARTAFVGALAFFGLVAPVQQMLPSVAATNGESVAHLGILLSALAAGGIIVNPFIRRMVAAGWTNSFLVDLGIIVAGPTLLVLGRSTNMALDIFLLVLLGGTWECLWVASQSAIQIQLPPDITGRMLGLFFSIVTLGTAVGSLLLGYLIDTAGARTSLTALGLLVCLYGLVSLLKLRGHFRERGEPAAETAATGAST